MATTTPKVRWLSPTRDNDWALGVRVRRDIQDAAARIIAAGQAGAPFDDGLLAGDFLDSFARDVVAELLRDCIAEYVEEDRRNGDDDASR